MSNVLDTSTNSFDLLTALDSQAAPGFVTLDKMTTATISKSPLLGSWSYNNDDASNVFFFATGLNHFPSNYWWASTLTADTSTQSLAVTMTQTNELYVQRRIDPILPLSFGLYVVQNLSNTTPQIMFHDMVVFAAPSGSNNCAVEYRSDVNCFYTHGSSNGVTLDGNWISGLTIGATNWVTGQITASNYTMAVYDPFSWGQIGTNSVVGRANETIDRFSFQNWMHGNAQAKTNYFDQLVILTNAVFPVMPTNFTNGHIP